MSIQMIKLIPTKQTCVKQFCLIMICTVGWTILTGRDLVDDWDAPGVTWLDTVAEGAAVLCLLLML